MLPTEEQKSSIPIEPGICPICGNEVKYSGNQWYRSWECSVCDITGVEHYSLDFTAHEISRRNAPDKSEYFNAPARRIVIEVSDNTMKLKEKPSGVAIELVDNDTETYLKISSAEFTKTVKAANKGGVRHA